MAAAVAMLNTIVVKNTFISVLDEEDVMRDESVSPRRRSVPPCARLATGSTPVASPSRRSASPSKRSGSPSKRGAFFYGKQRAGSDVSTEFSEDDTTPNFQMGSETCSFSECSDQQALPTPQQSPQQPVRTPLNKNAVMYQPRPMAPAAVVLQVPTPVSNPIANAPWTQKEQSSAAALSGANGTDPPPAPPDVPDLLLKKPTRAFRHLCFKTAAAVREVLADYVNEVKIVEGTNHWAVVAIVKPMHLGQEEKLRSLAKDTIMNQAKAIGKMCVLGYRRRPFTNIPFGFSASLTPVAHKDYACWGAFARGCCTNGENCKWEHPSCASTISVAIRSE